MPGLLKLNGPADSPNFAAWVFAHVSAIMTVLRLYAGPIVHCVFSPIGSAWSSVRPLRLAA